MKLINWHAQLVSILLVGWIDPDRERSSFNDFGGGKFDTESVFMVVGSGRNFYWLSIWIAT